jgi:hypothetical protein
MLFRTLLIIPILATTVNDCAQTTPPADSWTAYRNCRERLQQSYDREEISGATMKANITIECENGFTPTATKAPEPPTPTGAGTR